MKRVGSFLCIIFKFVFLSIADVSKVPTPLWGDVKRRLSNLCVFIWEKKSM